MASTAALTAASVVVVGLVAAVVEAAVDLESFLEVEAFGLTISGREWFFFYYRPLSLN